MKHKRTLSRLLPWLATAAIGAAPMARAQVVINELMAANGSAVSNAGEFPDWLELYNNTALTQNLSGMMLTDDAAVPGKYVLPANTSVPAHGFLLIWFDRATTSPGLHSGFGLSSAGQSIYLYRSAAAGGGLLDSVTFGIQAINFSIGRVPDGSGAWQLNVPTPSASNQPRTPGATAGLVINEWLASSSPGTSDWFELYNPGLDPVALSGGVFSPQTTQPTNAAVVPLSFIGSQQFVQFFADKILTNGANHVDFKLASAGGSVTFFAADRVGVVDRVTYGAQVRDVSQGYLPDGNRAVVVSFPSTPTPGGSNRLPLRNGVIINEALAHTDPPLEDAIELYNPTSLPADVSGHYLSNVELDPKRYRIPSGTFIPAGGYLVVYEQEFNATPGVPPAFTLNSAHGDQVWLTEVDGAGLPTGYRTGVRFGASGNGVSFGRHPTSTGGEVFVAMSQRSFGADFPVTLEEFRTGRGLANPYPKVGPIVINELMYHPPDVVTGVDNVADEYIELRNILGTPAPMYDPAAPGNRWKLAVAVDFTFPAGATIPAGGTAIIVSFDPATNVTALADFKAKYAVPAGAVIYGPYTGKLSNRADDLQLLKPDPPQTPPHPDAGFVPYVLVDEVNYGTTAPWPASPDGLGDSLQRRSPTLFGNDVANWSGAPPSVGRDNGISSPAAPVITQPPASLAVVQGRSALFTVSANGDPPPSFQWRFKGVPLLGKTASSLFLSSAQPSDEGDYDVVVSNSVNAVTSSAAHLTVHVPASVVISPISQVVTQGDAVVISSTASGDAPFTYLWFKAAPGGNLASATILPGATAATLPFNSVKAADAGDYWVQATDAYGTAISDMATLTVLVKPIITQPPLSQSAHLGDTVSLEVAVTGTVPFSFQWIHDGTAVPGATNSQLVLTNLQSVDTGKYHVLVSNLVGSATSSDAQIDLLSLTLRIESVSVSGTNLLIQFSAEAGKLYSVETRDSLGAGTWLAQRSFSSAPTNRVILFTDPLGTGVPTRFYRLASP